MWAQRSLPWRSSNLRLESRWGILPPFWSNFLHYQPLLESRRHEFLLKRILQCACILHRDLPHSIYPAGSLRRQVDIDITQGHFVHLTKNFFVGFRCGPWCRDVIIAFLWCFAGRDIVEKFVFEELCLERLDSFWRVCFEIADRNCTGIRIRAKGVRILSYWFARLHDIVLQCCDTVAESCGNIWQTLFVLLITCRNVTAGYWLGTMINEWTFDDKVV